MSMNQRQHGHLMEQKLHFQENTKIRKKIGSKKFGLWIQMVVDKGDFHLKLYTRSVSDGVSDTGFLEAFLPKNTAVAQPAANALIRGIVTAVGERVVHPQGSPL